MDDETAQSVDARDAVHKQAMVRFRAAVEPQIQVREMALEARRFASIPGAQWEGAWGDQFDNSIKLAINKVGRAIRKLENDYRQNRIVPDFRPAGGASDIDTANTLDGLHRADSYHFKAQQARDNAFSEAARGGFGAYRLTTEYADPLDKDSDEQRINPGMLIPDADQTVFFDPNSKLYDKSDARYAFVLTQLSPEAFQEAWPDALYVTWPQELLQLDRWYDWYRPDYIVQAEYYTIEEQAESLLIYTLPATGEEQRFWERETEAEDRADLTAKGWRMTKRRIKRKRCYKYVLSGAEVLQDRRRIAGSSIPIVPVYHERDYIDGVERFKGVVQDRMDAQRLYNSNVSRLAEINAMAPYERPIFDPSQITPNIADLWARGNIDRHPYALANVLRNEDGSIAVPGPIGKVEPPQVPQTTAALLEISNRDLTEDDADDSQQVKANTSEEAMQLAAQRIDAKSGPALDNMRQSIQREGEIYLDMACEVYAEEGREVETMTEDGDDGSATLYEDYLDGNTLKVRNDFANGRYKVMASVTEATATRRDRTVKQMMTVAEVAIQAQDVEGAQAALITASANMDGEGIDEFQDWNRQRGLKLGLFKPNEDEQREMDEAAQQQQQQPDPNMLVAQAQTRALQAGAAKDEAEAEAVGIKARAEAAERGASALLKTAQARAVGGPEQAPEAPTGLSAANDQAQVEERFASADLKRAQARKLDHDIRDQRIRTGAEIMEMERQGAA